MVLSNGSLLSSEGLGVALQSQQRNLNELYSYGDANGDCRGFEPTETIDLHPFSNLRNVGLPLKFQFISQEQAASRRISVSTTTISKTIDIDYPLPSLKG